MGAVLYWEGRTFFWQYYLVLQLSVEALTSFGHFPGWKEQSTVQEMLAAAVAEDQQAESQRRQTDQHRCQVSFWCIKLNVYRPLYFLRKQFYISQCFKQFSQFQNLVKSRLKNTMIPGKAIRLAGRLSLESTHEVF